MERAAIEVVDYERMYEAAAEMARSLIQEANEQGEKILRLEAEIRELWVQAEELRFNPNHDPENGQFTSAENDGKGVDFSGESGIIEANATGANTLLKKGFRNKQSLNNHKKHIHEYEQDGITTLEQYEKRAVALLEMPVGGNILDHLDKNNHIIRYDKDRNDYAKGSIFKGIITMFKPKDGYSYYQTNREEDIKHGGKA